MCRRDAVARGATESGSSASSAIAHPPAGLEAAKPRVAHRMTQRYLHQLIYRGDVLSPESTATEVFIVSSGTSAAQ